MWLHIVVILATSIGGFKITQRTQRAVLQKEGVNPSVRGKSACLINGYQGLEMLLWKGQNASMLKRFSLLNIQNLLFFLDCVKITPNKEKLK